MEILEAVNFIRANIKPQSVAAAACGYSTAHFCVILGAVRKGQHISNKAENTIIRYAEDVKQ